MFVLVQAAPFSSRHKSLLTPALTSPFSLPGIPHTCHFFFFFANPHLFKTTTNSDDDDDNLSRPVYYAICRTPESAHTSGSYHKRRSFTRSSSSWRCRRRTQSSYIGGRCQCDEHIWTVCRLTRYCRRKVRLVFSSSLTSEQCNSYLGCSTKVVEQRTRLTRLS